MPVSRTPPVSACRQAARRRAGVQDGFSLYASGLRSMEMAPAGQYVMQRWQARQRAWSGMGRSLNV